MQLWFYVPVSSNGLGLLVFTQDNVSSNLITGSHGVYNLKVRYLPVKEGKRGQYPLYTLMNCIKCNKETNNPKFCSRSCSVSVNNKGLIRNGKKPGECLVCSNKLRGSSQKYCSGPCRGRAARLAKIEEWLEGKITGLTSQGLVIDAVKAYMRETRGDRCESCGWNEVHSITKVVPVQVDHIDGNSTNNRPENLRLLCPSCHSLTPTYGGLNKGNGRKQRYNKLD